MTKPTCGPMPIARPLKPPSFAPAARCRCRARRCRARSGPRTPPAPEHRQRRGVGDAQRQSVAVRVQAGDDRPACAAAGDEVLPASGVGLQVQVDRRIGPTRNRGGGCEATENAWHPEPYAAGFRVLERPAVATAICLDDEACRGPGIVVPRDVDQFSPTIRSPVIDSYGSLLGGFYRFVRRKYQRPIGPEPSDSGRQDKPVQR